MVPSSVLKQQDWELFSTFGCIAFGSDFQKQYKVYEMSVDGASVDVAS